MRSAPTDSLTPAPDDPSILSAILPPDRFSTRPADRLAWAPDASIYYRIPQAVLFPSTVDELTRCIQAANTHRIPYTFRTGGTSLSGQAVTSGWLIVLTRNWNAVHVASNGESVTVQPGITGEIVNRRLVPFGRKIGPDPASIHAAMMGGILANNASGMCCGVSQNAYHTLESLQVVLPDGSFFSHPDHPLPDHLETGLLRLRDQVRANSRLVEAIRKTYQIKNTLGYSLNAFLDFDDPADIFQHLMIGSEGTLGCITAATLRTVPDLPHRISALFLTQSLREAARLTGLLETTAPVAVELMDGECMASFGEVPGAWGLPSGDSARSKALLLVEWASADPVSSTAIQTLLSRINAPAPLLITSDDPERLQLWKLRKGLFPTVGAARKAGTSVIIEDVAVPTAVFGEFTTDLRQLLDDCGFEQSVLFGHARDGNLHFVIAADFSDSLVVQAYDRMIQQLVELVIRYEGSLKAEHGTGRNMAPFVETAWGEDAMQVMKQLKGLFDPTGLCNPGVIIPDHQSAHLEGLKSIHPVDPLIDSCIECGFCEPTCPSRNLTWSPRQRIAVARAMKQSPLSAGSLTESWLHAGNATCATDSLCALHCPVGIDTGAFIKSDRQRRQTGMSNQIAQSMRSGFRLVESAARTGVSVLHRIKPTPVDRKPGIPLPGADWYPGVVAKPARVPAPRYLWFQSCISRTVGGYANASPLGILIPELFGLVQIPLQIPDSRGYCCGMPFLSKGFTDTGREAWEHTIRMVFAASDGGAIPVFCENSPCTATLQTPPHGVSAEIRQLHKRLTILDSPQVILSAFSPHLPPPDMQPVWIHTVCSVHKHQTAGQLKQVATLLADPVNDWSEQACCGMAGDRGLSVPDLTRVAQEPICQSHAAAGNPPVFSTSRTCEASLSQSLNQNVRSIWHLLRQQLTASSKTNSSD